MNDTIDDLEPVDAENLLADFSDYTIAELVLEIKELRKSLAHEKKITAVKQFKCERAEKELEELTTRINTARAHLRGDTETPEETE
jgi:hypothetical protein